MNASRDAILSAIRRHTGGKAPAPLSKPPVPARAVALDRDGRIRLFIRMAEAARASVAVLPGESAIPEAVAGYLAGGGPGMALRLAPDPALEGLGWKDHPALAVSSGRARPGDAASLTACIAGIAETGTLMLASGPHSPTTLNFLPDIHIVVLKRERIVATYEEAWRLLPSGGKGGALPRLVNFVTGPSRTADIEQRLVLGAHGPRRLHILLIGEAGA